MRTESILSVKELTRYLKMKLEGDELLQDVWVRGEISNFTHHSSGHMYFTLKDADSRIKCIMFASQNQKLAFLPREGTKVIAGGYISVYERDGQYQLYVMQMQPDGIGTLYLAYEQLKKRLEAEGLFAAEHKKTIPRFPKAIGVITSPTGAAIRDILITLKRRHPSLPVIVFPVLVQGTQAAASIARAIETMNKMSEVDLLIVGRGGGSLEELWAFNEEAVARSIFASQIPVISAVGHETDFTIADFVADLRAPTPTAAAELAVPHHAELKQQIHHLRQRLKQSLYGQWQRKRDRHERLRRSPVLRQPRKYLLDPAQRLDRLRDRLLHKMQAAVSRHKERMIRVERSLSAYNPRQQMLFCKKRLVSARRQAVLAMQTTQREKRQNWLSLIRQMDALSPLKVMQRGYSLVYDEKEKRLIKSIEQVQLGDIVKIRLTDGRMHCHVWAMEEKSDGQG